MDSNLYYAFKLRVSWNESLSIYVTQTACKSRTNNWNKIEIFK